jgi:polyisoprenoid-binding protein YceI
MHMKSAFCLPFVALAATSIAPEASAAEQFRIDPDHTFVHFAVVHTGVSSIHGRFAVTKGNATVDAAQKLATVTVEIDVRSIDTGVKKLDGILTGELFFDVARFKTARFSGHAITFAEDAPTQFDGEVTIKGITQPARLTAEHFVCKEVAIFTLTRFVCGGDLSTTLKRSDFGLSKYLSMVSDEVRIQISVEAIRD